MTESPDTVVRWVAAAVQTALFVAAAPLLAGWIKRVKCHMQNRAAPSLLQPYRDLAKLFRKEIVLAENASWLFRTAPYVVFGAFVLAAAVVPLVAVHLPTAAIADVIVLVGFFALARFFQALAGLDIGTAFGGMGSSREMTVASLAEPAMLMAVFTLAMVASTTNLSVAIEHNLDAGLVLRPSFLFALLGLAMVAIAETGRIPVDNPATHLELTMLHEAMVLEYSGRHLALVEWAGQIKLMIYAVLIANIFFPWGIAQDFAPLALGVGMVAVAAKLAALGIALVVWETVIAKMRLFRVPQFLGFAFLLALLGMLTQVILETG
ncbi:formate hydrogenlyase [Sulfurifustis variabilis]|uniref:Formate hydrogenlyase n=1 Tax=Sulfurifustis variabilis TaxID=1675686 RepID=A0A1C7AFB9_9GAMM|nr:formate hydrogenlyase [Sulfurifustis variabilis]